MPATSVACALAPQRTLHRTPTPCHTHLRLSNGSVHRAQAFARRGRLLLQRRGVLAQLGALALDLAGGA
jgi:hypothetical protein